MSLAREKWQFGMDGAPPERGGLGSALDNGFPTRPVADQLLSVDEAAERLGLKVPTIRARILRRKIGFCKVGPRAVRIPAAEIEKLIERGFVPALRERNGR